MRRPLNFIHVASADFITRSAYQMDKTPVLPIFAATLGASGPFLGFIVSVSTLTGFVLKPLIGILSDRFGRRVWLIIGTLFFVGTHIDLFIPQKDFLACASSMDWPRPSRVLLHLLLWPRGNRKVLEKN